MISNLGAGILPVNPLRLTPRQRQVLPLLYTGMTQKEIGAKLKVHPTCARAHMNAVYHKFGVKSRAEFMALKIEELRKRIRELTGGTT